MAAAEAELSCRFPPSFRQKMQDENNGGAVATEEDDFELFKILDRADRNRFARTSADNIVKENELARQWRGFPDHAVAIGSKGNGDLLVFLRGDDGVLGDPVFDWLHETAELVRVADAFSDLEAL